MQTDTLNDALVKIINAEHAGHMTVELTPASKLLHSVLQIMQHSGYIGTFEARGPPTRWFIPGDPSGRHQPMRCGEATSQRATLRV